MAPLCNRELLAGIRPFPLLAALNAGLAAGSGSSSAAAATGAVLWWLFHGQSGVASCRSRLGGLRRIPRGPKTPAAGGFFLVPSTSCSITFYRAAFRVGKRGVLCSGGKAVQRGLRLEPFSAVSARSVRPLGAARAGGIAVMCAACGLPSRP